MTTPIKSPAQKKHKGDEGVDEDLQLIAVSQSLPPQSVTLSAIEQLLDRKLDPMHGFLQQIHFDLNAFKESVRVELETVGLRITETEKKVAETMTRIEELEREMGKMRASSRQEVGNSKFLSMVVGNIPEVSSLEEAKVWLNKHCVKSGLTPPGPMDVYTKGPFSNLIFVKCQSETHRDCFIQSTRDFSKLHRDSNRGEVASSQLFAKVDLPFEIRTVEGALYAMKKMLISWNFNALEIKYDIHIGVLAVGGREIVKVRVQDFSLKFEWCDGEWQTWEELQDSPEMADIASKAQTRLEKAKARASNKGKGKGPE
ncbi:Cpox [Symbiodinium sp. CCMP2592]|nr:Cpox [Symbiodinium sp. CCMP2592]